MKVCKNNECNNVVTGKGSTCSPKCRKAASRQTVTPTVTKEPDNVTLEAPTVTNVTPKPSTVTKCDKVPTQEQFRLIKSKLAGGVSQPTGLPTAETAALSALDLRNRVSGYDGPAWMASPEYAEVCLRLVTWAKARLIESGQAVPAWKDTL